MASMHALRTNPLRCIAAAKSAAPAHHRRGVNFNSAAHGCNNLVNAEAQHARATTTDTLTSAREGELAAGLRIR